MPVCLREITQIWLTMRNIADHADHVTRANLMVRTVRGLIQCDPQHPIPADHQPSMWKSDPQTTSADPARALSNPSIKGALAMALPTRLAPWESELG